MSVPKQKKAKSSVRKGQYKNRLKKIVLSVCPKCKKPVLSHHACSFCGTYAGKKIIKPRQEIKKEKNNKNKHKKEKEKGKEKINN